MKKDLHNYAVKITKTQKAFEANSAARAGIGKHLAELTEQIRAIKVSIKEVQSISTQVKILSLNASVEAVRAGTEGRAFSVVATEINTLAQRTDAASERIEENVIYMQKLLDNTTADMIKAKELGAEFETQLRQCVKEANELVLLSGDNN